MTQDEKFALWMAASAPFLKSRFGFEQLDRALELRDYLNSHWEAAASSETVFIDTADGPRPVHVSHLVDDN